MNREDVVRISESVIRELRLVDERPCITEPNRIAIHLKYKNQTIDTVYLDVKDRREYEG